MNRYAFIPQLARNIASIVLWVGWAMPGLAQETTIQHDQLYTENMRLHSAWTGISFDVLPGYRGAYVIDTKGVIMESATDKRLIGVYGFSEVGLEDMAEVLVTLIEDQEIQLNALRVDQVNDQTIEGQFIAITQEGIGSLFGIVRTGAHGNALGIAVLGAQGTDAEVEQVAKDVLATVSWDAPDTPDWQALIGGRHFTTSGADSHYSPGGAGGGGSYASGSSASIDFCSDGSYGFESESESYISIEGASAQSTSRDAHQGHWSLVADLAGKVTLVLSSTDGRYFYWPIDETQTGAVINGTSYAVERSSVCY